METSRYFYQLVFVQAQVNGAANHEEAVQLVQASGLVIPLHELKPATRQGTANTITLNGHPTRDGIQRIGTDFGYVEYALIRKPIQSAKQLAYLETGKVAKPGPGPKAKYRRR